MREWQPMIVLKTVTLDTGETVKGPLLLMVRRTEAGKVYRWPTVEEALQFKSAEAW